MRTARYFPDIQVWLFGSALRSKNPADIDILLVYEDRTTLLALREMSTQEESWPPIHVIAMTSREEDEYNFIATTEAVRLI